MVDYQKLTTLLVPLVQEAAKQLFAYYQQYLHAAEIDVKTKPDKTPLTEADLFSQRLIIATLAKLTPEIPILSEESDPITFATRKSWQRYWLIDPLDGTHEFLAGNDEFTINIALIEQHKPVLGIIAVPAKETCYFAYSGGNAYKQEGSGKPLLIRTRSVPPSQLIVVASRRHGCTELSALLTKISGYELMQMGSALKFCCIAEGNADLYLRTWPTSEWDTAAGQCIVEQAGGRVVDMQWQPLRYNTRESLINSNFAVVGDPHYDWQQFFST